MLNLDSSSFIWWTSTLPPPQDFQHFVLHHIPLLEIRYFSPLASQDFKDVSGIIITSQHAIPSLASCSLDMPLWCVGESTAQALQQKGFFRIQKYAHTANELAKMIPPSSQDFFLYVRGKEIQLDILPLLREKNIRAKEKIVYKAHLTKNLPKPIFFLLMQKKRGGIFLFSQRGAYQLKYILKKESLDKDLSFINLYCLSSGIAELVKDFSWNNIYISTKPTRKELSNFLKYEN